MIFHFLVINSPGIYFYIWYEVGIWFNCSICVTSQLSQHHLLTNTLFLHCFVESPLWAITFLQLCGFVSVSFLFIGIFLYLWHLYYTLNYYNLKIGLDIIRPTSLFFFKIVWPWFFHMYVRISCAPVYLCLCLASFSELLFTVSGWNPAMLVVSSSFNSFDLWT